MSVHDVSPLTWRQVQTILKALTGIGVCKRSLLVIPNHHGTAPIDQAEAEFQTWLKTASQQDEICLHGYEHRAETLQGGTLARLVATVYTNREGEFYQLGADEAARRVRQGIHQLKGLGIQPQGFVAPAWLLSDGGEAALRALGFEYTTRLGSIKILTDPPQRLRAPTLCYSVRSGWRRALSRLWNPALLRLAGRSLVLRAAVHPADVDHPVIFRRILSLIRQGAQDRTIATYQEVVQYSMKRMQHMEWRR